METAHVGWPAMQVIGARVGPRECTSPPQHVGALVKRFDTESFSDFSAKSSNFRRLVLGCMDSYDSESRRIFQHFSRSTRLSFLRTAQISKFLQKIVNFFRIFVEISAKIAIFQNFSSNFAPILMKLSRNFVEFCKN